MSHFISTILQPVIQEAKQPCHRTKDMLSRVKRINETVKNKLVKSNPFKKLGCRWVGCAVCALGGDVDCRARKVHYKISCEGSNVNRKRCQNKNYEGETSRSTGEQFGGHMNVLRSKNEKTQQGSFLCKHVWESHNGAIQPLKLEVLKKFPQDPALQQAREAVSIWINKPTLNGKEEWSNEPRKPKAPRVNMTS